jgi:16S rRNA (cytidine1402-2'-O)-methyltransferase
VNYLSDNRNTTRNFTLRQSVLTAPALPCGLYLVSTPIGNLGDISLRALETLAGCFLIACEDTRTSGILLARYGIRTQKTSYNEHNAGYKGAEILRLLAQGEAVALISDAGTPLVSDPGSRLVKAAIEADIAVIPIPGASAPIAALVASGLPGEQFLFAGFLPSKQGARLRRLAEFSHINATLIFFESPKRLAASLGDMVTTFGGERQAAVAREITKMHETFYRSDLASLAVEFSTGTAPKGEIVVLIDAAAIAEHSDDDIDQELIELLKNLPTGKAAAQLSEKTGLSKRTLYQRALALKETNGGS